MLNKLLPNQVAGYWDSLKHGIEQSCPSDVHLDGSGLNQYLVALMSGSMQAWMLTDRDGEKINYYGNLITRITTDEITGSKNLLMVSLYLFQSASDELWLDAYKALIDFGKANSCKKLTAYTNNPAVLNRSKHFQFNIDWSVVSKDI